MKIFASLLGVLILASVFFSLRAEKDFVTSRFFAMGTLVSITLPEERESEIKNAAAFMNRLAEEIAKETKIFSEMPPGCMQVGEDFLNLYEISKKYYTESGELFDPTAAAVSRLYGFPGGPFQIPEKEKLKKAKAAAGLKHVYRKSGKICKKTPLSIDFGASGKGYIIDASAAFLKKRGVKNFIIEAGGDLFVSGKKNGKDFIIGVRRPGSPQNASSLIEARNMGIATSGDYERFFIARGVKVNHIFSGVDFEPADNYASLSAAAPTAEEADSLATFYYLLDIEKIEKICLRKNTPVMIIKKTGEILKLCGWGAMEISQ